MAQQDSQIPIQANQAPPAPFIMQLEQGSVSLQYASLYNGSSMTISLFPGQQNGNGVPPIICSPFQAIGVPIALYKNVYCLFSGSNSQAGQVYLHWSDQPGVPFTTPYGSPIVAQPSNFILGWVPIAGTDSLTGGASGDSSLSQGVSLPAGKVLYIASVNFSGLDLQRLGWQLNCVVNGVPVTPSNRIFCRGNFSQAFTFPYPMYSNSSAAAKTVQLSLVTTEAYTPTITPYGFATGYIQ